MQGRLCTQINPIMFVPFKRYRGRQFNTILSKLRVRIELSIGMLKGQFRNEGNLSLLVKLGVCLD